MHCETADDNNSSNLANYTINKTINLRCAKQFAGIARNLQSPHVKNFKDYVFVVKTGKRGLATFLLQANS